MTCHDFEVVYGEILSLGGRGEIRQESGALQAPASWAAGAASVQAEMWRCANGRVSG